MESIEEIASKHIHISHISRVDDEKNYKQGYQDAVEKACGWFKDYLNTEMPDIDDWLLGSPNIGSGEERFRKAMEESI